jgi:hypothetical protein
VTSVVEHAASATEKDINRFASTFIVSIIEIHDSNPSPLIHPIKP